MLLPDEYQHTLGGRSYMHGTTIASFFALQGYEVDLQLRRKPIIGCVGYEDHPTGDCCGEVNVSGKIFYLYQTKDRLHSVPNSCEIQKKLLYYNDTFKNLIHARVGNNVQLWSTHLWFLVAPVAAGEINTCEVTQRRSNLFYVTMSVGDKTVYKNTVYVK